MIFHNIEFLKNRPPIVDGGRFHEFTDSHKDRLKSAIILLNIDRVKRGIHPFEYKHLRCIKSGKHFLYTSKLSLFCGRDPMAETVFIYIRDNDLISVGHISFNLSSSRYATHYTYVSQIKRVPLARGDFIEKLKNSVDLKSFKTSNARIANNIDFCGSCIFIEGHRNAMIGAKEDLSGILVIETCNTTMSTWTSTYRDLVEIDGSYFEIVESYKEKDPPYLSKVFTDPSGSYGTFDNSHSRYKWLETRRDWFFS